MLSEIRLLSVLGLVSVAAAATHDIQVGIDGITFTPNATTAAKVDTVVFHFHPGKHNVVQGTFASPCTPLSGGFYSGYINSNSGEAADVFTVTINDTNPLWVYCSQVGHCQGGMAAVINAPSSGDTLGAYVSTAALTSNSNTPAAVAGGVISANSNSTSSSSSSATSSASKTTSGSGSSTVDAASAKSTSGASGIANEKNIVLSAVLAVVAVVAGWTVVI